MSASLGIYDDDVVGGEDEVELKEDTEWCLWSNERLANLVLITAKAHQPRLVLRADKCYRNAGPSSHSLLYRCINILFHCGVLLRAM